MVFVQKSSENDLDSFLLDIITMDLLTDINLIKIPRNGILSKLIQSIINK